jgi:pimeloyl-ACP methyl ester carboxylesterase
VISHLRRAMIVAGLLVAAVGAASSAIAYRDSDRLLRPPSQLALAAGHDDPARTLGIVFRNVRVADPLGPMPAWLVPGRSRTWVIAVHGMWAPRAEALPVVEDAHRLGFPVLVISYRNDLGAPSSPDGLSHLGASEWHDLDAATAFALTHGARRFVLVGYSLGGMIVCDFLHSSPRARDAAGAILDSPVLDWRPTISHLAATAGTPSALTGLTARVISWRIGTPLSSLDELSWAGELRVPTLVIEGDRDRITPPAQGLELAAARPDLVRLVRFPAAGHADAWRVSPRRYRAAVDGLLRQAALPQPSFSASSTMIPAGPRT